MQETEKFIKAVKKYPCIWNVYIPTYKCRETKDAAWREIIKETSACEDIDAAKDKWKKLKDAFREAINKRKKDLRLGKTRKMGRQYKFQHVMEFLIPILENQSSNGERSEKSEEILSNTDDEGNETRFSSHSEQDAMAYLQVESDTHEPAPVSSSVSQRRGWKRNHSSDMLEFLMEDAHRREVNNTNGTGPVYNELDSLDKFFLSMAETTKNLPEHMQLAVKRKVFNAVIEAEEVNLRNGYNISNDTTEYQDVKPDVVDA